MTTLRYLGPLMAIAFLAYAIASQETVNVAVGIVLGLLAVAALHINDKLHEDES